MTFSEVDLGLTAGQVGLRDERVDGLPTGLDADLSAAGRSQPGEGDRSQLALLVLLGRTARCTDHADVRTIIHLDAVGSGRVKSRDQAESQAGLRPLLHPRQLSFRMLMSRVQSYPAVHRLCRPLRQVAGITPTEWPSLSYR